MITSPYETFALKRNNMVSVQKGLETLYIQNRLSTIQEVHDWDNFCIRALLGQYEEIPLFYQPITLALPERKTAIVIDLRPYAKFLQSIDETTYKVGTMNEQVNQLIFNALLIGQWREDSVHVTAYNDIPMMVYGSLLSEAVGRKVGLDPATTLNLMATFQIFYATRGHRNIANLKEEEKFSLSLSLSRKMKVDLNTHKLIMDKIQPEDLEDVQSICQFIAKQGWSTRLNHFSARDLITLTMNGWVGQGNPKETMMVAIEFPPTFISLCYLAARSTFYQKMPLGQVIKRLDRGNNLKGFTINTQSLLGVDL